MIDKIKKDLPVPEKILSVHEIKEAVEKISFFPQIKTIYEIWKEEKSKDKDFINYSLAFMQNLSNFDLHEIINERLQIHAHNLSLVKTTLLTKDLNLLKRCIDNMIKKEGNIFETFEAIKEASQDIEKLRWLCENMEKTLTKQSSLENRVKTKDWRREIKKMRETIKEQKQALSNIVFEFERIHGQLNKIPNIRNIH
ncbi:MAG: hypothetical protein QW331_04880, partial [Candidatus Woesearchaeota archaeon]